MKYGESAFDLFYLITAVTVGILILKKTKDRQGKLMALAVLILGCGDAFHLVPRILHYFTDTDLTSALGIGKLVTSLTMTVFYVLLYRLWILWYGEKEKRSTTGAVYALAVIRALFCAFPQNGWITNDAGMLWGIIRNVPFVILGILIIVLYWRNRKKEHVFRHMWLYMLLSFAFYIPVAVFAGILPVLGMLMLPKTICYLFMIFTFRKAAGNGPAPAF